jgi:hypothetical protein
VEKQMFKLKRFLLGVACSALGWFAMANARAALINVQQAYPDITLSGTTLIYDANGVDASTGLLRVVSLASTLNRAPGASTTAQGYTGTGDSVANVMLSFAINNATGALVANPTYNKVTIGFGNAAVASPTAFGFSWQGNISAFGANANGTAFDALWSLTGDQYQAMPAGFGAFVNGYLTGQSGGLKITNAAGAIGATNIWAFDWLRGQFAGASGSAYAAPIAPYVAGFSLAADRMAGTVVADVFVPLPAAAWLMFGGLISFLPMVRRKLATG